MGDIPNKTMAKLLLCVSLALLLQSAHALSTPVEHQAIRRRQLRSDVCADVRAICEFVVANCGEKSDGATLDPRCVESFEEYARDSDVFKSCEDQVATRSTVSSDEGSDRSITLVGQFKELYSVWQQVHVCETFHATEKKAARVCAGENVHRPWNADTWPLFCHQTFTNYKETRHEMDALCEKTADSPAFWEGFVDYIASATCKQYYDFVRGAGKHECAANIEDVTCVHMFEWYERKQREVEVDCFELHSAKLFYKGFYRWKGRQQHH
ncbi:hypothetical protein FI667_g17399, partial [Globisporangium splendens]